VLGATLLVGYVAFGSFITRQIVFLTGLYSLVYLLMILANDGVAAMLQPKTRIGRAFVVTAGFRRESLDQIAILLSGALRVALTVWAVLWTLAPWRIGSGDMVATLQGAFFGFNVGDATISVSTIAVALVLFVVGIVVTRGVQRWLDVTYLPHTGLDTGLRNSIKTSFGYLGVIVAVAVAASYLGLSFEKVTYVAGALSVGIGFGLQAVVSNFVSGLIILWERAIRVGDWIVVGADEGFVRRINVRSTEIETFDRATVIVPNQNLMTGVVKNWVRGDRVGRILLPITVGLAAKPEDMRDMLIGIAKDHDRVLKIPTPSVLFSSYAGDQMTFNLICFVEDVEAGKRTTSDLLFTIHARLMEKGIIAPAGPAQLSSPALEEAIALLMQDKEASIRQARRA
jgi:potassium-dependent mechanosensitive channel